MPTVPPAYSSEAISITSDPPRAEDWREPIVQAHSSPSLERLFRRHTGLAPAVTPYIAPHPWAYRPFLFLMNPDLRAIDDELCSQICFVVARDNACRFCYGSFRVFLRVAGYSSAELNRLEEKLYLNTENDPEHPAFKFAVSISQGRLEQKSTIAQLQKVGYEAKAIREIAGIAVTATLINRVATMLSVPLNESAESFTSQWFFDLLQPVVQGLLEGWQQYATPTMAPLDTDEVEGPLGPWIRRLRGTCVGSVIHDCTRKWLRCDSALPLRTKLFVLAVIARGLNAAALEERAATLLHDHCDVAAPAVTAVVDHLRGEAVDERTAGLLRLARESIRYEAGQIQTVVRERVQDVSRAETLDAIATLGLCNALARLHVLAPVGS